MFAFLIKESILYSIILFESYRKKLNYKIMLIHLFFFLQSLHSIYILSNISISILYSYYPMYPK